MRQSEFYSDNHYNAKYSITIWAGLLPFIDRTEEIGMTFHRPYETGLSPPHMAGQKPGHVGWMFQLLGFFREARIKSTNRGWGFMGLDLNSGWN